MPCALNVDFYYLLYYYCEAPIDHTKYVVNFSLHILPYLGHVSTTMFILLNRQFETEFEVDFF